MTETNQLKRSLAADGITDCDHVADLERLNRIEIHADCGDRHLHVIDFGSRIAGEEDRSC